jgi:hypothetical protein
MLKDLNAKLDPQPFHKLQFLLEPLGAVRDVRIEKPRRGGGENVRSGAGGVCG